MSSAIVGAVCLTPGVPWGPLQERCSHPFLRPSLKKGPREQEGSLLELCFCESSEEVYPWGARGCTHCLCALSERHWPESMAVQLQPALKMYLVYMPTVLYRNQTVLCTVSQCDHCQPAYFDLLEIVIDKKLNLFLQIREKKGERQVLER